jgi:hypothetical protein
MQNTSLGAFFGFRFPSLNVVLRRLVSVFYTEDLKENERRRSRKKKGNGPLTQKGNWLYILGNQLLI